MSENDLSLTEDVICSGSEIVAPRIELIPGCGEPSSLKYAEERLACDENDATDGQPHTRSEQ
jgi:hypothetical protein